MTDRLIDLDDALDRHIGHGDPIEVQRQGGSAHIDVAEADRIGVRVRSVRVRRDAGVDALTEAERLPGRLRTLPEPVRPVEVDAGLKRAILRTEPEAIRGGDYFEVDVRGESGEIEVRRYHAPETGGREARPWTMTRDGLRRLIEELE